MAGTHTYANEGVYRVRVTITDPAATARRRSGAWTATAAMLNVRNFFSAVTGADGRVYVLGGYDPNAPIAAVDAYDPGTDTWTTVTQLPASRFEFAATTGQDGRMYVLGGFDANYLVTNLAEAYDPVANTWTTLSPMPTGRRDFTAVTGPDGRIYALGGYDSNYNVLSSVEVYDPALLAWSTVAGMLSPRTEFGAGLGQDGRIYALGGYNASYDILSSVEAYDPAADAWVFVADMSNARVDLAAAAGTDGRIYALGGNVPNVGYTNAVEAYDPAANAWNAAAPMSTSRVYFAAATAGDGRLYALGGYTSAGYSNSVEAFSVGALVAASTDTDHDGVSDAVEDGAPNSGDGNDDGFPDSQQANVASLPNAVDASFATLVASNPAALENVAALANPSPANAPAGVNFPVGYFRFSATNLTPGAAVTVTLLLEHATSISTYYVYGKTADNPIDHWYAFLFDGTTGAEFDSSGPTTQIVLHFQDGERGDNDLTADGTVFDPSAPANVTMATPGVSGSISDGTYNGLPFDATVTVAGTDGIPAPSLEGVFPTLSYYAGAGVDPNGLLTNAPVDVGTYTVVAHFAGSAHYTSADSAPAVFVISPAPLAVTVDADPNTAAQDAFTKVYGAAQSGVHSAVRGVRGRRHRYVAGWHAGVQHAGHRQQPGGQLRRLRRRPDLQQLHARLCRRHLECRSIRGRLRRRARLVSHFVLQQRCAARLRFSFVPGD